LTRVNFGVVAPRQGGFEEAGMAEVIRSWQMRAAGEPLVLAERPAPEPGPGQVLVEVAGCGVCHTDLGFLYDGVRPKRPLPLTLGHEISGVVTQVGPGAEDLAGRAVVVPAVLPCGACEPCRAGRGQICPEQTFLGNDIDGGFASHVLVPARGLCVVDQDALARAGLELVELAVLADAISTPYQAILRSGLESGDVAVFVGAGGVGAFGVQIARALGAHVAALDVDEDRLERVAEYGAELTRSSAAREPRELKKWLRAHARELGWPQNRWKIFECSGAAAGQELAFELLNHGAHLSVVGFTLARTHLRLSNLMALDAVAAGNWGCLPEHYPGALDLILGGAVAIAPFVERRPMSAINQTLRELHDRRLSRRPILVPDFDGEDGR
jgi:6-hydroxycyclohex-1-ene-1-carbonyl-CoA dehydrogenase